MARDGCLHAAALAAVTPGPVNRSARRERVADNSVTRLQGSSNLKPQTKTKLAVVVTLDTVADDMNAHRLAELPAGALERLAERVGIAKTRIDLALMIGNRNGSAAPPTMLSVDEAATLVGRSPAWVRAMAKRKNWSFAHRVSRKLMLLDRDGLEKWIATRRT